MRDYSLLRILRDSLLMAVVLGIPAGVLSNAISNALFSHRPNWLYALSVTLIVIVLVLLYVIFRLYSILRAALSNPGTPTAIEKLLPAHRKSVGDLILEARNEIAFFGISAKRTVTEDAFRRSLERIEHRGIRIRFLLLDPSCEAFEERAREEGEPSDAWRADLQTTMTRLRAYRNNMSLDIQLRYFSTYPIWRAIIVDRERVYVSTFLPGRRGTESIQYIMSGVDEQLAYGIIKSYTVAWKNAREVKP